ncbi:hypothetical protein A4R35_01860 [Thermogemmatispora tikiterensis]|uniref:Uncharacterized protein n=1 Tax=Thermogemmatispora tikiterensis TaxID=1825093 RepID=A0A328V9M9_9CHLR|nr:hypothetical protein A4R35_01860 [Thermogemmatispora tikiterensis]
MQAVDEQSSCQNEARPRVSEVLSLCALFKVCSALLVLPLFNLARSFLFLFLLISAPDPDGPASSF